MVGLLSSEVLNLANIIGIQKHFMLHKLNLSISVSSVQNKDISILLLSNAHELVFQSSWLELWPEFNYVYVQYWLLQQDTLKGTGEIEIQELWPNDYI